MKIIRVVSLAAMCSLGVVGVCARAQASDSDKKFLAKAAQGDQNEIALGKLAAEKASNPAVREFGQHMVTEHTRMTESMKPFAEAWGLPAATGPDEDTQKELDKLNGLSGKDFDKEYVGVMVDDHTKDLKEFESEVKDTKDAKFRQAVMNGKSHVAAHKNMAYDLKKKL